MRKFVLLLLLCCFAFDFAKAFDKVPHRNSRLLHKLDYCGIRGSTYSVYINGFNHYNGFNLNTKILIHIDVSDIFIVQGYIMLRMRQYSKQMKT